MKKLFILFICIKVLIFLPGCSNSKNPVDSSTPNDSSSASSYKLEFNFTGPGVSSPIVYACWLEDSAEENIQNIYICNRLTDGSLTGDALPYWTTVKYPEFSEIDGVTGSSVQQTLTVIRDLEISPVRLFRVCFEVDRSKNDNTYFVDRPCFIYKTDLIDLDNLESVYNLNLLGWMSNSTTGGQYSQQPIISIPGFEQYKLMEDLIYIENHDDMVTALTVQVSIK